MSLKVMKNLFKGRIESNAISAANRTEYYLTDHLGSIRTTIDDQGNVLGYDDYYPFGLAMPGRSLNSGTPNDLNKFTGHERDQEAGLDLDYMLARNYDFTRAFASASESNNKNEYCAILRQYLILKSIQSTNLLGRNCNKSRLNIPKADLQPNTQSDLQS